MFKGLAAVAAAAVMVMALSAPGDARAKQKKRYVQPSWDWRMRTPSLDGRELTPSLDGYVTGRARTCGYATFQYDNLGVPYGPYCH
jgi:hypothetical protein